MTSTARVSRYRASGPEMTSQTIGGHCKAYPAIYSHSDQTYNSGKKEKWNELFLIKAMMTLNRYIGVAEKIIMGANKQTIIKNNSADQTRVVNNKFLSMLRQSQNGGGPISIERDNKEFLYVLQDQKLNVTNVCSEGQVDSKILQQSGKDNYTFESIDIVQINDALAKLASSQTSSNAIWSLSINQAIHANTQLILSTNLLQNMVSDFTKGTFQTLK